MNPFQFEVCCSICGGPGVATSRGAAAEWLGSVAHSNPAVCQQYLEQKAAGLAAREQALEDKV